MTVSSTTTRNSYTGDGSTTVFAYTFKIFDDDDITVILRTTATGAETVQTKTTNYSVSGVGNAGGGNITFTSAPASTQTVVLLRQTAQTQSTDYTPNDPFPAAAHEDALDKLTLLAQDQQDELDRAIKLSRTNTMTSTEFTVGATDRANKILAFDSSGELAVTQEIGTFQGTDATTTTAPYNQRDLIKSTTAAQLNNVYICIADSVAGDLLTDTDHFELLVDAVSAATSETNAASSAATATTKASEAATSATNAATSATSASTAQTAAETAKTAAETAQAAAEAALDTFDDRFLGAKSSDPTLDNDGNALLDGALYFDTTANLMKVYDQSGTQWVQLALTGTNQTNVNLVAGQISPTNNISTVAGAIGDGTFANATTFAAKYRTGSTDPTDSLDAGDLFFNTTSNTLKVYNGSGWVDATLQGATITTFEFTATAGQTAFTGNDDNGASLNYNTANALVTINGVIIPSSDYTTTSATTLTLDADAAAEAGDSVIIISYSEFTASVADISTDTTPTLGGNLDVGGNSIVSTNDGDINITPNGTGKVKIDNVSIDGNTIACEETNGDLVFTSNGTGDVQFESVNTDSVFMLKLTDNSATAGPALNLTRDTNSPADNDDIGTIRFIGKSLSGQFNTYATIYAETIDVSSGTENGNLNFSLDGTIGNDFTFSAESNGTAQLAMATEATFKWTNHKGTSLDCTLDWETPTQDNTVKFPNASGTLGYVALSTTTITSATAEIVLDNLSDDFDTFRFLINAHPVNDAVEFNAQFLDSSGTAISAADTYAYYRLMDGSDATGNGDTMITMTLNTVGSSNHEGVLIDCTLQGRNFTTSSVEVHPPALHGNALGHYNSSVISGGPFYGAMNDNNVQAIRGIKFFFSSGDVARATVQVFGVQNT